MRQICCPLSSISLDKSNYNKSKFSRYRKSTNLPMAFEDLPMYSYTQQGYKPLYHLLASRCEAAINGLNLQKREYREILTNFG